MTWNPNIFQTRKPYQLQTSTSYSRIDQDPRLTCAQVL